MTLVGCGGPPAHVTDPGPTAIPQGFTAASDAESGVSLAYPSGWRPGQYPVMTLGSMDSGSGETAIPDPNAGDPAAKLDTALQKANKQMDTQEQKALKQQGIVLMFNDGSKPIPSEENTRFYLQTKDDVRGLADAADVFAQTMVFAKKTPIDTAIGKCIRLNSDYTNKIGDKLHEIGYVWADGSKGYALRFICTGEKQPIASVAEPVMNTVRIKPQKN